MISLYALLLLNFVRQSTTSPPQTIDWAQLLLTSGVVVAIVGVVGNIVLAQLKRVNDEHTTTISEKLESAKAERVQDINLSDTLSQMTQALKASLDLSIRTAHTGEERNKLQARTADVMVTYAEALEAMGERIKVMTADMKDGRDEIVTKVAAKVSAQHEENAKALKAIQDDINALNTQSLVEVKEQLTTIMDRLGEVKTALAETVTSTFLTGQISELHQEVKTLTDNVDELAASIERMLTAPAAEIKPEVTPQ